MLEANENSHLFSPLMIQSITLVPSRSVQALSGFLKGDFDILPMDTYWGNPDGFAIKNDPSFHIYETVPSRVSVVLSNPTSLTDFSPSDRLFIGGKIAEANRRLHPQPGAQDTTEFLQLASDGALTSAMRSEIEKLRNSDLDHKIKRPLRFGISQKDFAKMKSLLQNVPEIEVISYPSHPSDSPEKDWPDAMTMVADISSNDILSMVTSYINSCLLVPGLDQAKWLGDFVSLPDRSSRSHSLRDLHFKALKNGSAVPIVVTPYLAATRGALRFDANKVQPTMDMWTIRRD